MRTCTVDEVISWKPRVERDYAGWVCYGYTRERVCDGYTRERVEELFAGREELTAFDLLELDIPAEDRLWGVLRLDLLSESQLRDFVRWCAQQVLHLWDPCAVIERYLETGDELIGDTAEAAARAAARATSWVAARAAARATAGAAARLFAGHYEWLCHLRSSGA